jgi:hypothetical protein
MRLKRANCTSRRAQSTIKVKNAVVGILVSSQEYCGVSDFGRISHSV